jgi:addiction module HigA family antidote
MAATHVPFKSAGTPYPGRLLRDHVLPGLSLSISQAARDLGVSRQTLHRIFDGTTAITPETAARLESLCGVSSMFWLRLQCEYDLQRAQASLVDVLARIPKRTLPATIRKQLGVIDGR